MKRIGWVLVSLTTGYVMPEILKSRQYALKTMRISQKRLPGVVFDLKPVFIDDSVPDAF